MSRSGPPRFGRWLLTRARIGERHDEIAADLAAIYARRAAERGRAYATRRYVADALSLRHVHRTRSARPVWTPGAIERFWYDLRHACRGLGRRPGHALTIAVTLAVGIAANVSAFAVVDRLLLAAPPGVADASHLRRLHIDVPEMEGRFTWFQMPYRVYSGLGKIRIGAFEDLTAFRRAAGSVGRGDSARPAAAVFADGRYFDLLGVRPLLGRFFGRDDDQAPDGRLVAVLSHQFWHTAFAGDPGVVGREITYGARSFTVIGIAPRDFSGDGFDPIDIWMPLHAGAAEMPPTWTTQANFRALTVVARLANGVSDSAAAEEAAAAVRAAGTGTDAANAGTRVLLASLAPGRAVDGRLTQDAEIALWLEIVAVLLLAAALANVVNLQLERAAANERDVAIRTALGVSRARLVRQALIEAGVVAFVAAAVALVAGLWGSAAIQGLMMPTAGTAGDGGIAVTGRLIAVTVACAGFAAMVCGVATSAQLRRPLPVTLLRSGRGGDGGSRSRTRRALLVAQVAVSVVLLVGAGLFLRSMMRMRALDFGIDPDQVLVLQLPLRHAGYTNERIESFYQRALVALGANENIASVAAGQSAPFSPSLLTSVAVPDLERPPFTQRTHPTYYAVTPGHFETLGMEILRGRGFTDADTASSEPVVLVEENLGTHIWPGGDPIGKCLKIGGATQPCRTIVGVTSNTRRFVARADGALRYYIPITQRVSQNPPQVLLIRPRGDVAVATAAARSTLLRMAPDLPFVRLRVLRDLAEPETRPWRLGASLLSVFGVLALGVAAMGVYGLLSAIGAQRAREMGVRLALGATPGRLVRLVLAQSFKWQLAGAGLGLLMAFLAARKVEPLLFETRAIDPAVYLIAIVSLLASAAVATIVPALRASRVDPNRALRDSD